MSAHFAAEVRLSGYGDPAALLSTTVAAIVLLAFLAHRIAEYSELPLIETLWNFIVRLMPARLLGLQSSTQALGSASATHAAKSQALRSLFGLDRLDHPVNSALEATHAPKGLGNWDNSCYQNSVLQALSSVPSVASFLHRYNNLARPVNDLPEAQSTVKELSGLMSRLNGDGTSSSYLWTPPRLKSMNSWQQQDAQEYFARISEDIEKEFSQALGQGLSVGGLETVADKSIERPRLALKNMPQDLTNVLEGLLAQRVGCTACGYVEGVSLIPFTSITLPLANTFSCDVADCLDEFTNLESIEGVECVRCSLLQAQKALLETGDPGPVHTDLLENDNDNNNDEMTSQNSSEAQNSKLQAIDETLEAQDFSDRALAACSISKDSRVNVTKTKQTVIVRPPQCLTLHFNRSMFDGMTGELKKNYAAAAYPKELNLKEWCMSFKLDKDERRIMDPVASMLAQSGAPPDAEGQFMYDLCAVVTHFGRHENGHYICFRKLQPVIGGSEKPTARDILVSGDSESIWWRISDERVSAVSERDALSQEGAFMLFYEQRVSKGNDGEIRDAINKPLSTADDSKSLDQVDGL